MNTKLTTQGQVAGLRPGDTLERFPCNCADGPLDRFDDSRPRHIIQYEIRSIDQRTGLFSLITTNYRTLAITSPVDIGRLIISDADLLAQSVWWIHP